MSNETPASREKLIAILRALDNWPHSWRQDGMLPLFDEIRKVLAKEGKPYEQ